MAPRKRVLREAEDDGEATQPPPTRLTRSSARRALQARSVPKPPQKKKALKREKEKTVESGNDAKDEETVGRTGTKSEGEEEVKEAQPLTSEEKRKERTVIIEHW